MLRIGLTGGIASGKSTVANLFAALGVDLIDTDAIARELVEPGTPALAAIREAFGPDVLTAGGELDRRRLRNIVFADAAKRRKLEAILHPRIRREALARAESSDAPYVMLAVPLLFESGFDRLVDRSLVVDCPETVQLERLIRRDDVAETEARAVMAAQMSRESRRQAADDVIDNGGSLESTRAQVLALHERYLDLARNCPKGKAHAE